MSNLNEILNRPPPETLYHYTSQEGLIGIARSKEIWASGIQFLNDPEELHGAIGSMTLEITQRLNQPASKQERALLSQILLKLQRIAKIAIYVFSLSENGDLLSQWRGYSAFGRGFSIGFGGRELSLLAERQNFRLAPCLYDPSLQHQMLQGLISEAVNNFTSTNTQDLSSLEALSDNFIQRFFTIAPIFKPHGFYEEKEWRLISQPISFYNEKIHYRPGNSTIIPYFRFNIALADEQTAIQTVIVGPAQDHDLASQVVMPLLQSRGIKATVRFSRMSYRTL